jgi:hypothetical protein
MSVSTHVLDAGLGRPAQAVAVLERASDKTRGDVGARRRETHSSVLAFTHSY